jgi:hypothetical protein
MDGCRQARKGGVEPVEVVPELGGYRWSGQLDVEDRGRLFRFREQLFDTANHELGLERLGQHAVAASLSRFTLIDWLERTGQEKHGNVRQPGRLLDVLRNLVPRFSGHADVGQDDVRRGRVEHGDGLLAIADRHDLNIFVGERQLDDALNGDAVVS